MTAHKREWAQLRVGCRVTLRDWRGDSIGATAFLGNNGEWLARTVTGAVYPVLPRELVAVENGAGAMYARLQEGARVEFAGWDGSIVRGCAVLLKCGDWCCKDSSGAKWLIQPHALIAVTTGED